MNPEAVIFDLDGTLLDTERLYARAFHLAAARLGVALPRGFHARLVGIASPDRAALLRHALGGDFPTAALLLEYRRQRSLLLRPGIPLRPGAASLLRRLARPAAIATAASHATASQNLRRAGIAGCFTHVVTRDHVARGKPAPDAFLEAARRLGTPPERCLAVEDSAPGARAARAAGMSVILLPAEPHREAARISTARPDR